MSLFIFFEALFFIYFVVAGYLAFICLKRWKMKVLGGLLILSILGLFYSAYLEPSLVKTRTQEIDSAKINEEIKIVLVSDWHLRPGKGAGFVKDTAEKISYLRPDVILMAGDYLFFDDFKRFKDDLAALGQLTKIAPTFAVLGNHDYGIGDPEQSFLFPDHHQQITQLFEENGIRVLRDEKEKIKIKGVEIWLAGFDEFWRPQKKPWSALKELADAPLFKIGLSHNPDAAFTPEAKVLDILLSGHTHGGQIRLPFIGALGDAETIIPLADYGRYLPYHQPPIFNTVGLGESGAPFRFFNRPEIVLLKIK